jgi:hypothetical protein
MAALMGGAILNAALKAPHPNMRKPRTLGTPALRHQKQNVTSREADSESREWCVGREVAVPILVPLRHPEARRTLQPSEGSGVDYF